MIVFMESFPLKNFWKHVIIINTHSDSTTPIFKIKMEKHQYFIEKILKEKILIDFMEQNSIDKPKELKEYFIESFGYLIYPDIYKDERKKLDLIIKRYSRI